MIAAPETGMNSDHARQQAEKAFRQNEDARGAQSAMTDYEIRCRDIREKIERLRALRVAKETQEQNSKRGE
jgi:hypothetical protein